MDQLWCIREREESGMNARAWPEKLEEWASHLLRRQRHKITSCTKSAAPSGSTAATLTEARKGRRLPLVPGVGLTLGQQVM